MAKKNQHWEVVFCIMLTQGELMWKKPAIYPQVRG